MGKKDIEDGVYSAFEYAWRLGEIPEADIRTTGDGVIICLHLDFKDVDLRELSALIESYDLGSRIIFCHNNQQNCIQMKELIGNIRTMLWIGGSKETIEKKFEDVLSTQFEGLDQVQLHLNDGDGASSWRYELDIPYIKDCHEKTGKFGVDLEVLSYEFEREDIRTLLDIGIRWFAIDYLEKFVAYCM